MSTEKPVLRALTGLRFLAALHVVLFHRREDFLGGAPAWVRHIMDQGFAGVSLFFVLSGFILAYTYSDKSRELRELPRKFWGARFARVYPVYLTGLALAAPFLVSGLLTAHGPLGALVRAAGHIAFNLGLVQAWLPQTACVLNCPGWSLSNEAFFYFLFPFVAPALDRLPERKLLGLSALAWFASLVFPLAYMALAPDGPDSVSPHSFAFWITALKFNPLARLPEFLLGVVLGKLFMLRGGRVRWPAALSMGAAVALIGGFILLADAAYPLRHNGIYSPLFALLILGLTSDESLLGRLLASRVMVVLGEASYSLYILHWPLWQYVRPWLMPMPRPASALLYVGGMVAISILTYRLIELPARERLRRLSFFNPQRVTARPSESALATRAAPGPRAAPDS